MQCPYLVHKPTTINAARCARSKLACCAFSQETASAVACSRMPRCSWLTMGNLSWHVAPRPLADGERLIAGVVPCLVHEATMASATCRARARSKLAC